MRLSLATTLFPASLLTGVAAAQVNDDCAGAISVGVGATAFDNTGATTSSPPISCEPTQGNSDLWYSFVAPTTQPYIFETCGSSFDTIIEVLEGTCASNTVAGCNDDGCGLQSSTLVPVTAGNQYLIRVAGWGSGQGAGTLTISASSAIPNDDCAGALPATPGLGTTAWDNTNASTSTPPFTCEPVFGQTDIWYTWTAPTSAVHIFDTCGSSIDTVLEVFEGSCAGPVVACNDDGCGTQSSTSAATTAGTDYLIRIGGWNGNTGSGSLTISLSTVINDECSGALTAMVGTTPFDNTGSSTSSPPFACEPVQGQADVWFDFNAPTSGLYTIETCGSALNDTVLEVFEGDCATGTVVGCNDDFCAFTSLVVVPTTAGTDYKIRVGGWGGLEGTGTLTISEFTPTGLDLAAHYKLDEASGFTAADSSGNGNDGTYNNVMQGQPGAAPGTGNSARFDGATATVDIPASASLDDLRFDLSACAWVNVDAAVPSTYRIFSNNGPNGSWSFALVPNGIAFTTHAILDYISNPVTYVPGTWHHVCVVMSETNDVSFYFDGQFVGTQVGLSATNTPTSEYHIGAWDPGFTIPQFFDGRIDDLQIYAGQLSASDVMTLFNNPGTTLGDPSIGTQYCGPAVPNSTGQPGDLRAEGNTAVVLNDVTLIASDISNNSFGFFLVSRTQGFTTNPGGSQGNLCLSGAIGRYVGPGQIQNTGAAGEFSLALDLNNIPQPTGFVSAMAGDVFNFQGWHRDAVGGMATSNFTNGVEIMFQ